MGPKPKFFGGFQSLKFNFDFSLLLFYYRQNLMNGEKTFPQIYWNHKWIGKRIE